MHELTRAAVALLAGQRAFRLKPYISLPPRFVAGSLYEGTRSRSSSSSRGGATATSEAFQLQPGRSQRCTRVIIQSLSDRCRVRMEPDRMTRAER